MPSHPRIIKSWLLLILKEQISGVGTTTFGFPPLLKILASVSPNVRLTDSLPGKTLIGPMIISGIEFGSDPIDATVAVWYI